MTVQTGSDPSALLTAALEKLLYLETRLDSAEAARDDAVRETERQRLAVRSARQALADWQKRATDAEVAAEGAEREVALLRTALARSQEEKNAAPREEELAVALKAAEERLARFEAERETWLDRMVVLQRLGSGGDELDLGAFISELRAELLALRRGDTNRPRATVADRPAVPSPSTILAEAPAGQIDVNDLIARARLPRGERTLATLCARDLQSDSPTVRRRAAERLLESRVSTLAPFVASLIGREKEASVRTAYVRVIDLSDAETSVLALQQSMLDEDRQVRAAALDALSRRGLIDRAAVLRDQSPAIRRRALTHLAGTAAAVDMATDALKDDDPSVRRVAALALATRTGREVDQLLAVAMKSGDREVRQVAEESLSRRVGPGSPPLPETSEKPPPPARSLEPEILQTIRMALRGSTIEELAGILSADTATIASIAERLVSDGRLIWRGKKLYLP